MSTGYRYKYSKAFEDDGYFAKYHVMIWKDERCMHREGCDDAGGLRVLERDFIDWCRETGTPIPRSELFTLALRELGHKIENVAGVDMVAGVFLKADAWVLECMR